MELLQFEKEYRIHVYEIGPDGKLNLFSLFNYLQDIASEHAVKLGFGRDDLMREKPILGSFKDVCNRFDMARMGRDNYCQNMAKRN